MPTLNIILHGLFAVIEEPLRVVAAAPSIPDHDKYVIAVQNGSPAQRYGRGTYELTGTTPLGSIQGAMRARVPPDKNAKIRGAGYTEVFTTAPPAYAVFILPSPLNIVSCRCLCSPDIVFTGGDAGEIKSTQFATINVLTYQFDDIHELSFTGLPDLDWRYSNGTGPFVNVAIVSSGHHDATAKVSAAFDKMMKDLCPGKDIHLVQVNPNPQPTVSCLGTIGGIDRSTFEQLFGFEVNFFDDDCVGLVIDNV
jgi:hypothetical protein